MRTGKVKTMQFTHLCHFTHMVMVETGTHELRCNTISVAKVLFPLMDFYKTGPTLEGVLKNRHLYVDGRPKRAGKGLSAC